MELAVKSLDEIEGTDCIPKEANKHLDRMNLLGDLNITDHERWPGLSSWESQNWGIGSFRESVLTRRHIRQWSSQGIVEENHHSLIHWQLPSTRLMCNSNSIRENQPYTSEDGMGGLTEVSKHNGHRHTARCRCVLSAELMALQLAFQ